MSKQELMKMQTCVLKVNIECHCDGCKKKIKKLLQKVDGVYNTTINAEQGKVTVTGNVDPGKLIKKLEKSGKHAQLWGAPKGSNNFQNIVNNQFKNMNMENGKGGGGKDNKSQKAGKGGQQGPQQHQMQQFKGSKVNMPQKDHKSVKFNLQDNYIDASDDDDDDDDEFGDEFDEFDDEFDDDFDDDDEEAFGHGQGQGQGQGHHLPNKMMPMVMSNGQGLNGSHAMINMPMFSDKKGGGGGAGGGGGGGGGKNSKKGGGDFEIPVVIKGKGSNNDGKNGKGGKKDGGDGGKNGHDKGGSKKQDRKDKNSGKSGGIGAFFSFGRKSKNGRDGSATDKSSRNNGAAAKNNHSNGPKKGGGKNEGVHDFNKSKQGYHDIDVNVGHGGAKNMGQMGQTRPVGNYGGMGNFPAVQGLPAAPPAINGGGYYQGQGMMMGGGGNPYNNQYMAMMMNQQRQNGNEMYQPMMYARPHPATNYMPPPPMPSHPMADPYTHFFSDENANSCSIM